MTATTTDLFIRHGELIAALPQDISEPVDDDDQVWIETLATAGPVGIPHDVMAEILGITLHEWLTPTMTTASNGSTDNDSDDFELYADG